MYSYFRTGHEKFSEIAGGRILSRYCMDKAWIVHETHFRKKHSKTEDYSKFFNLVQKNRKFKKGKMGVLRGINS